METLETLLRELREWLRGELPASTHIARDRGQLTEASPELPALLIDLEEVIFTQTGGGELAEAAVTLTLAASRTTADDPLPGLLATLHGALGRFRASVPARIACTEVRKLTPTAAWEAYRLTCRTAWSIDRPGGGTALVREAAIEVN